MSEQSVTKSLIIFIKNPIIGQVKTRLASDVGAVKALKVYKYLLNHTKTVASKIDCNRMLFYHKKIDHNDNWSKTSFDKQLQKKGNLGQRMMHAFKVAFAKQQSKVIIIGSDCPDISTQIIENAFAALSQNDVVIGPATDGGYYLLGMKRPLPFLFQNKPWSNSQLLKSTINDLNHHQLSFLLLPALNDIDTIDDLTKWKQKTQINL